MMEENGSKKVLLSVLGVAILLVAVVGISFAAFTFTNDDATTNTVSTGTIAMSYSEPTNGINLVDALPMSDDSGKGLSGAGNVFEFTVSTLASGTLSIPYEISVTPVAVTDGNGALTDSQVKVYLTKNGTAVVNPVLVSGLTASTVEGRTGSYTLYQTTDVHTGTAQTTTTTYVLRMWIDNSVTVASISDKTYEYRLKVNVDSAVAPLA